MCESIKILDHPKFRTVIVLKHIYMGKKMKPLTFQYKYIYKNENPPWTNPRSGSHDRTL